MELQMKLTLLFLFLSTPLPSLSLNDGFRFELSHVDSGQNMTKTELIRRAMVRTTHRISRLNGMQLFTSTNVTTSLTFGSPPAEYYMDIAIGTPPVHYSAIADTGSDLIWTKCNTPCKQCKSQPAPIYNPSNSSSISSVPCNSTVYLNLPSSGFCSYNYTYGTGWTSGVLDTETFTFGTTNPVKLSDITFGCSSSTSDDFNRSSGLVGLGRGNLSLVSQLNTSKFSYCLNSFLDANTTTSPLLFGPIASFHGSGVKSTPFVKNPSIHPTFYYLSLHGISLGRKKLAVTNTTFALNSDGTGGIIIDSGTTFTMLKSDAYQAVLDGIKSIVKLEVYDGPSIGHLNMCYSLQNDTSPPKMPNMKFHFEGADMELPVENYMVTFQNAWCLTILNNTLSGVGGVSIFGNYQQQNMHILYDLTKEVLSFSPAQCDKI